eukprot:8413716-Ditylum_brightwellii.AAC.1
MGTKVRAMQMAKPLRILLAMLLATKAKANIGEVINGCKGASSCEEHGYNEYAQGVDGFVARVDNSCTGPQACNFAAKAFESAEIPVAGNISNIINSCNCVDEGPCCRMLAQNGGMVENLIESCNDALATCGMLGSGDSMVGNVIRSCNGGRRNCKTFALNGR